MKKLLFSLGLVVALLGATIFTRAWAALPPHTAANVPAISYKLSSHAGTFVDISTNPNAVALGTDLADGADLTNYFFEPTTAGGTTPTSKKVTANATANSTESEFCFPLGFDFKISGYTMRYFLVNALGGAYFSPTPTREPATATPSGNYIGNCIHTSIYSTNPNAQNTSYSLTVNKAGCQTKIAGKAPAYYLIEGAAGNRVLTTQHHFLVNGDEWLYQIKFYEATSNFELVIGEIQTANIPDASSVAKTNAYQAIQFGLFESAPSVGTSTCTYCTNDTINASTDATRYWQLGMKIIPTLSSPHHKVYAARYTNEETGWDSPVPYGGGTAARNLRFTKGNAPEPGRTIRFSYPECQNPLPPFPESYYSVGKTNTDNSFTATIAYKTETYMDNGVFNIPDLGTIVAVSSASPEPDFTLENGTFYFKGHEFPESEGFVPTVLCNQMNDLRTTGNPPASTYGISSVTPISLQLTGLGKLDSRYIHIFRMSLACDGRPVYSPLCFTIAREPSLDAPQKFELTGTPTINSVGMSAEPASGTSIIILKSPNSMRVRPSGVLKKGDKIGDAEVVELLSEAKTWNQPLAENERCYFMAYSVDVSDPTHYVYSSFATKIVRYARAVYNGLPGVIDLTQEPYGNPNLEYDGTDSRTWGQIETNHYRDLPIGWTRETNIADGSKDQAFGLGSLGVGLPSALYAKFPTYSSTLAPTSLVPDAITPPVLTDKGRVQASYRVKIYEEGEEVSLKSDDEFTIQYKIGSGAWQTGASFTGSELSKNNDGVYTMSYDLINESMVGQQIRFRFTAKGASRKASSVSIGGGNGEKPAVLAILSVEIKELKSCLMPTAVTTVEVDVTPNAIPISWTDPNATQAPLYKVSYRKADTENDWSIKTASTTNTTLTDLSSSTVYQVVVTAVCSEEEESNPTDIVTFWTAYQFPYAESMVEDSGYWQMIQGTNAYFRGNGPLERRVTTYTGSLPNSGNASLTLDDGYAVRGWSPNNGWDKKVNNRRCPQSIAVSQMAKNAWFLTPPVYCNYESGKKQIVRFKATNAYMTETVNWTKGSVGSKYSSAKLYVLISKNGSFKKSDAIATINVGTETINDREFQIELPTAVNGWSKLAFYFENSSAPGDEEEVSNFMLFEIYDVAFEYEQGCPELEGELAITDITTEGATVSWTAAKRVNHYEISWGDAEDETVVVEEPTYTITGLKDYTAYNIKVVGFCDEEGNESTPNELTGEFTTLEACHTPTNFKVEDITYNSAAFSSTPATQESNTMLHRLIYLEDVNDASHVHLFKQENNVNPLVVTTLHDNRTVTARTRAVCARSDSSAWSAPVTFTTPVDPATLPDTFNMVLKVTPEGAGTVSTADGKTRYLEDDEVTMTATANDGYRFLRWQDAAGKLLSTNATYKWTATWEGEASDTKTHEIEFTAVFQKQYTITLNTEPEGTAGGTVTGDGVYDEGTEVTLEATAKSAYLFVKWQKADGSVLSTDNPYKFTPTESATYTAVFRAKQYFTLDATVVPNADWGSVSFNPQANEDDEFQEGRVVTMTATPAQYYKFVAWVNSENDQDTLSKERSYVVTMNGNKSVKAVFAHIQYTVTLVSNPSKDYGTINGTSGQPSDGGTFNAGTKRHLEAKPRPGYVFVKWMEGTTELGTNPVYEFILTKDITITACFEEKDPLDITVNVEPADAGTVEGAGQIARGDQAVLTATPNAHYAFKEWRRLDNSTISSNPYRFTPLRDYTFTAVFRALENYTITVTNTEGGTVTGAGTYEEGAQVTLTATPTEHYAFTEWQDENGETLETEATYTFTATGNTTVKAVFTELSKYTVTLLRYVNGNPTPAAGTLTGAGTYDEGTEVELKATANRGYRFIGWQTGGQTVSTDNPYTITVLANVTYRALYEEIIKIAVTVDPTGAGTVTGAGMYDEEDEVTLSIATVDDDYVFEAWLDADNDGNELSTEDPYTFTATESMNITAKFREKEYFDIDVTLLGSADDEDDLGSVSIPGGDNGEYQEGKTITMTATPKQYCRFVEWRDSKGKKLSEDPTYTFVITKNMQFYAVFAHIEYTVTLKSAPNTTYGTINGTTGSTSTGGTFNAGTTRRLEAKPRSGYEFVKWMSGTTELGTNPVLEFVLTQDTTITAYFKEKAELTITLNVKPTNAAGTVTGAGTVKRGENAVLTAKANAAYKFQYWERIDGTQHEANPYTLENVRRDYTFDAVFRTKYQYDITVTRVPNSSAGTITRTGFLSNGKAREDTTVTLTAVPAEGYMFTEWQDANGKQLSTNATLSVKVTANATYKAVFAEIPTPEYTVTLLRDPVEGGRVSGDGTYVEGTEATITATPNRLYRFDGWYDATDTKVSTGTELSYKFTVTGDVTYTAKFIKRNTVDVEVTVRLGETVNASVGTVTGAGEYLLNESVTLTATPASDEYVFSGWRDINNDDELIGSANPFTFTTSENVHYAAVFREKFEVTLNIDPEDAGTVTGAGSYKESATATITATANEGYVFTGWFDEDNHEVSVNRTYSFVVSGNVTYTAKFVTVDEEHRHTITVRRLPNNEAGTVTGAGRYLHGSQDTLRATASTNYLFVAWLRQNADDATKYDTVSKRNPYIFTVEEDVTYTALFRSRAHYTIEVDIKPNDNAGTVTMTSNNTEVVDGAVREGRTVTLAATPAEGYVFVAWVNPALTAPKDTVSRSATYTFTATGNATYYAIFRRTSINYTMTLNVTPAGAGTVDGAGSYHANASVTITAKPNSGYVFVGWRNLNGDMVSTEATYTFNITRNTTYTAVFRRTNQVYVNLNVTPEGAGTVEGAGAYVQGIEVSVEATPNRGYDFVEWQDEDGETLSTETKYSFTTEADVTYTAVFKERPLETYTVTVNVKPNDEAGTVEGAGSYVEGTMVTLTATPNKGYVFVEWQAEDGESLGANAIYTFELDADVTYTAVFEESELSMYAVALNVLPNPNAGTVTGAGRYQEGTTVTITATANEGYTFVKWQNENGEMLSLDATYTFELTADVTYTAVFVESTEPMYTVRLNVLPDPNAGTVTGAGTYKEGTMVTITATANEGYTFEAWQDKDGKTISTDATYTFEATADVTYTALFKKKTANEQQLKASFHVSASKGYLYIDNLNAVMVREVTVFNTLGRLLTHSKPNSCVNLTLPVDVRFSVLIVRVVSEQGEAVYKVYMH